MLGLLRPNRYSLLPTPYSLISYSLLPHLPCPRSSSTPPAIAPTATAPNACCDSLAEKAGGLTTVPQIWIGDTHVGGSDELHALDRAGKLDALLAG